MQVNPFSEIPRIHFPPLKIPSVNEAIMRRSDKVSPCQAERRSLFCPTPSMQKTKKSVAKRFKISGTGKLIRRTPGFRHLLAAKSTKSKRRASRDKLVAPGHAEPLFRCLPTGLR
jgi:large subunit ribosomal protein L35